MGNKADSKHDYYADLDLPPTADIESVKKQFRLLAKQFHPDRNPGKEIEVVPKFQAVQAAHEILADPQQKAQYDASRAKYLKKTDAEGYAFKRTTTARASPHAAAFQQDTRPRNSSVDRAQAAQGRPQPTSASAEKFAAFSRAGPQQWDRAKFEDAAAKAEALRNFQSMKSGQAQQQRPPRAPTAPKSSSTGPSTDYARPVNPQPGFPGLSRTQSARRPGFSPAPYGADEPPARQSAYDYVSSHRDKPPSQRPQSGYPYPPPPVSTSPPTQRTRPSVSPLRQSRSSGFDNVQRPAFGRAPSRYATNTGEKTDINSGGISRSTSVRNSPVERSWGDHGPFGARAQSQTQFRQQPPPRHHSASPQMRQKSAPEFEFSATDTSSSEEEVPVQRPKANARGPRPGVGARTNPANTFAFEGQFPNKNYTRLVDESQYQYPPPESRDAPHRKPFEDTTNSMNDITEGLSNTGIRSTSKDGPSYQSSQTPQSGDTAQQHPSAPHSHSTFSASEWDGKFAGGENIFRPSERDRRSPTKNTRQRAAPTRTRTQTVDSTDEDEVSPTMPGVRHVHSNESYPGRSKGFTRGKLEDWPEQATDQQFGNGSTVNAKPRPPPVTVEDVSQSQPPLRRRSANPDMMDVDINGNSGGLDAMNGASRRLSASAASVPPDSAAGARRLSNGGLNLSDLANTEPLKPSADGLDSMASDLVSSLPFKSRPAEHVTLTTPSGVTMKNLNLPRPPKPVTPPDQDHLTQSAWSGYATKMKQYMADWNAFEGLMLGHFVERRSQVNHIMYHNWLTSEGEGVHAEDVDSFDIKTPPTSAGTDGGGTGSQGRNSKLIAGYTTYMEWLDQDIMCRRYWDLAVDEHRECLEGLGKIRQCVKNMRDRNI